MAPPTSASVAPASPALRASTAGLALADTAKVRVPVSDSPSPTPNSKTRKGPEGNKGSLTWSTKSSSGLQKQQLSSSSGSGVGGSTNGIKALNSSQHDDVRKSTSNGRSIAPFAERHQPAAKAFMKPQSTAGPGSGTARKSPAGKPAPSALNWSAKSSSSAPSATSAASTPTAAAGAAAAGAAALDGAAALNVRQCTVPLSHLMRSAAVSVAGAAHSSLGNSRHPSNGGATSSGAGTLSTAGAAAAVGQSLMRPIHSQVLAMGDVAASCAGTASNGRAMQQRQAMTDPMRQLQLLLQQQQQQQQEQRPVSPPPVMLDGRLLLEAGGAAVPEDLLAADLSSQGLSRIEDGSCLAAFTALALLDLSDNRLAALGPLAALPALRCLAASANRLSTLADMRASCSSNSNSNSGSSSSASGGSGSRSSSNGALVHSEAVARAVGKVSDGQRSSAGNAASSSGANEDAAASTRAAANCSSSSKDAAAATSAGGCVVAVAEGAGNGEAGSGGTFIALEALDVSYNCLAAEELLGKESALAHLPRLSQLDASANALGSLPQSLGAFTSLRALSLTHNNLKSPCLAPLSQLPALKTLDLSHNCISSCPAAATGPGCFPALQMLNLSHNSRLECMADVAPLLLLLPSLLRLVLLGTPAAARARLKGQPPEHQLPDTHVEVVTHTGRSNTTTTSSSTTMRQQQYRLLHPPPAHIAPIFEAPPRAANLSAAARAQLAAVPHEAIVAAFARVEEGIEAWRLATVDEGEEEEGWDLPGQMFGGEEDEVQQQEQEQGPAEDNTFLTGVGIFEHGTAAASIPDDGVDAYTEDPTERVARLLGLDVQLLAHKTGRLVGDNAGAIATLKFALAHPLVDPDAGLAPDQHHMAATATSRSRRLERTLQPLPQPIPVALDTKVQKLQSIEGTLSGMKGRLQALESRLLQQLSAQAERMTNAATATTLPVPRAIMSEDMVLPLRRARVHSAGSSSMTQEEESEEQQEEDGEQSEPEKEEEADSTALLNSGHAEQDAAAVTRTGAYSEGCDQIDANGRDSCQPPADGQEEEEPSVEGAYMGAAAALGYQ